MFLLAFLSLSLFAWQRDLYDADEGRYASVAVNMVTSGDWVVPHLDGMPFMDKPPLVYWVQAAPTQVLGRSEFFARLPTLLAGAIWALMIFLLARAWTGHERKAWWAALLAATSAAGIIGSRVGPQMDMPLAAAIATALYAGWIGVRDGGRWPRVLLGIAVGCGLLIKGPLVGAVAFLVAMAWTAAGVPFRRVARTAFSPLAWGIAFAIAAPWYVLVERAQPGWIWHFISYEHLGRFSTGDHRAFHPFWFYVPIVLMYLAPWTPLAWGGFARVTKGGRLGRPLLGLAACSPWAPYSWDAALPRQLEVGGKRRVRAGRIAWLWFLTAFVLYSISTRKLLNYLLPAAAPLFVLAGARLDGLLHRRAWQPRWLPLVVGIGMVVVGVLLLAGLVFPFSTGRLPTDMQASRWAPGGLPLILAGVLVVGGLLAWARATRDVVRAGILIACVACGWWLVDWSLARIDRIGSSHALADELHRHAEKADLLVVLKRYPQGLEFYGGPRLWIAGGTPEDWEQREIVNPYARRAWEAAGGEKLDPVARAADGGVLTSAQFERLWSGTTAVLVVCRWGEVAQLGGTMLAGPLGGGGRTDLFLLLNHPKSASGGN